MILIVCCASAQEYTPSAVFAHNDYVRENPFHTAYDLGVGYIEADVFLRDGQLMVAHHRNEIADGRTLQNLYLEPLSQKARQFNGNVYKNPDQTLTLMIDLKTEGMHTLNAIVDLIDNYPELIRSPNLQFMISGNVPHPQKWVEYPPYIFFDGRPGIAYSPEQMKRISMISTNFSSASKWDGHGRISNEDRKKMQKFIDDAHAHGKKFRFWATPDFPGAWKELMSMNMDVIVTDDVAGLIAFLSSKD
jgi:alkaline phosphatase